MAAKAAARGWRQDTMGAFMTTRTIKTIALLGSASALALLMGCMAPAGASDEDDLDDTATSAADDVDDTAIDADEEAVAETQDALWGRGWGGRGLGGLGYGGRGWGRG